MNTRTTELLSSVVRATSSETGERFFRNLARSLSEALGVRYCFVTECLDEPPSRVGTLAFWADGKFANNIEYDLLLTPCDQVITGKSCRYGSDVQTLFPDDEDLTLLQAESYAAAPMIGSNGDTVGHLVILDSKPMDEHAPDLSLLELLATRASAELERQRATAELATSEARLRQIIDLVPHFIFAKNQMGQFILANQAVADAYGTSVTDLHGKTDADFSADAEEVERFRLDDLEVIIGGHTKHIPEETVTDAAGHQRILQTVKIPFTCADSAQPTMLGVSIDITEQKESQERLRSVVEGTAGTVGEAFFRSLARHLATAIGARYAVVAELNGQRVVARAVWAGDDFIEGLEYDLPGSPCQQATINRELSFFGEHLQQQFPDHTLLAEMGAESYLGAPLFDASGQAIGMLAVLDDQPMQDPLLNRYLISIFASRAAAEIERERLEAHRRQLQAQVLHVQKLESLGVLAGGIAHDFNNLLSGILGNVDLALMMQPDNSPIRHFLEEIERAANRSADLSNQMLAYSGKGRFVVETTDLNQLVEEMTGLLRSSVSKKAQMEFRPGASLPPFECDGTQIRQVVMNLITNASDAIGEREGKILVHTGLREVDAHWLSQAYLAESLPAGEYLFLDVTDNGCGMDKETRDRLFDPFFTTKRTGRGLGLAALLGIVRGHHGAVRVDSQPDEGSTFTILLPVASITPPAVTPTVQEPAQDWHAAGKVLLVDDEEIVRSAVGTMLEVAGFEILVAENGRQGIELFRHHSDDISAVVLDMMMPDLDGLETFRELRRIRPSVKVILSSGYTEQAMIASIEQEGFAGFLKKPYRPAELDSMLRKILGG